MTGHYPYQKTITDFIITAIVRLLINGVRGDGSRQRRGLNTSLTIAKRVSCGIPGRGNLSYFSLHDGIALPTTPRTVFLEA